MRSLLFVPADSERKLEKAPACGADVIILDLEDAVAAEDKEAARKGAVSFLNSRPAGGPAVHVRVNGHASGMLGADLDAIVPARPDTILLPKATGGNDISLLSAMVAAREAIADIDDGAVRLAAIATETAGSIFRLNTYKGASARLTGLAWSSEDLTVALGAETNRDDTGAFTDPFRLARALCLYAAADAGVTAIDRVFPNFRDGKGLEAEARIARRDGFTAKLAIHPDQVAIINDVFTPTADQIARAKAIVAAFAAAPGAGVVGLDGEMLDLPHLVRARGVLARTPGGSSGA
jgi:citrate lyase subunit beta / citryl-CoA lyase